MHPPLCRGCVEKWKRLVDWRAYVWEGLTSRTVVDIPMIEMNRSWSLVPQLVLSAHAMAGILLGKNCGSTKPTQNRWHGRRSFVPASFHRTGRDQSRGQPFIYKVSFGSELLRPRGHHCCYGLGGATSCGRPFLPVTTCWFANESGRGRVCIVKANQKDADLGRLLQQSLERAAGLFRGITHVHRKVINVKMNLLPVSKTTIPKETLLTSSTITKHH